MSRKKSAAAGGTDSVGGGAAVHHVIEYRLLSDLNPAPYNPRSMSDAARKGLSASIQRFGSVVPIIWNRQTGNIVGGHQQYYDLLSRGVEGSDVRVVDLSEAEEKALNIALNNPALQGNFTSSLAELIAELEVVMPEAISELRFDTIHIDLPPVDVAAEWEGMPEFEQAEVGPHRQLIVSFRSDGDVKAFGKLVGQKITAKTKSFWWPAAEPDSTKELCYVDEDKA